MLGYYFLRGGASEGKRALPARLEFDGPMGKRSNSVTKTRSTLLASRPERGAPAGDGDGQLGLRERKKAATRRRIADAALALIRERGYEGATIDEIVARVDVSQPTFYKYYPSKDAILREHALVGFGALLAGVLGRPGTVVERMCHYFVAVARQMEADKELWYAIAVSNAYNPVRDPQLLASSNAGTRVLEGAIEEGQRRGEFTEAYTARRLASLLEGVMLRICVEWGAGFPDRRPLGSTMSEGFELFLRAARPANGDVRLSNGPSSGTSQGRKRRPNKRGKQPR
jgi:AcrR family transcriptional regulator